MLSSGPYTISLPLSLSPVPHSCPPPAFPFFHGQKGDREKRTKKGGWRRGKRNRRNGKNDMKKQERDRRKVEKENIPNVRLSRKQF
jgi:hypothetical protein